MRENYVDIISIRRMVFAEIARLAYEEIPLDQLNDSIYRLMPGEKASYRDSIFKERAIIGERLRLALGMDARKASDNRSITSGIDEIDVDTRIFDPPLVDVITFACEACPEKYVYITDNCRKCIAHPCINVCPKDAISMGKDRAIIDQEKCIKCGQCVKVCPYSSILVTGRPCSQSCGVKAIGSDELGRAEIDHEKCVACGQCITACPFGAISDKSEIYQLIKALKSNQELLAIVAPSFAGQFGQMTTPEQIFEAIKHLGFKDVVEVGLGADLTTLNEAKEYVEHVPDRHPYLGTSCCYSWYWMVEKNYPDSFPHISNSSTPMIYTAEYIKKNYPDAKVVFIGPCTSKKLEAIQGPATGYVDFVITFEELMGMFIGAGIEPSEIEIDESKRPKDASTTGRNYGVAGGVAEAVKQRALEMDPDIDMPIERADSLGECVKIMKLAEAGRKDGYLIEGMGCPGGCVGGAGTLVSLNRASKSVNKFAKESPYKSPADNDKIDELKPR